MPRQFYFAWVDASETTFLEAHERKDEHVLGFRVSHSEGSFASLEVEIKNPRQGFLSPGRKQWVWLSVDDDNTGGNDATPLFFGQLVAIPNDMHRERVLLTFIAKPNDFDEQKRALAETLKVVPYWDDVWINPEQRDDPDAVLEARPEDFHFDRITHEVTISNLIAGEDGTISIDQSESFYDKLTMSFTGIPLRKLRVEAEVSWKQQASGVINFTQEVLDAFAAVGTDDAGLISSFTGQGLYDDWPEEGDDIGSGWSCGVQEIKQADGVLVRLEYKNVKLKYLTAPEEEVPPSQQLPPVTGKFQLWRFLVNCEAVYKIERNYSEKLIFELNADVQSVVSEPGEEEFELLTLSSTAVGVPLDPADTFSEIPIGDISRREYFNIDRAKDTSVPFLLCLARARMLERARVVRITIGVPFEIAIELSCRMNATITDYRLPGGVATGKIVDYSFSRDAGQVTIACCVGQGNSIAGAAGSPSYVDAGYVDSPYQLYVGAVLEIVPGEVTYNDYYVEPNDDGIVFPLTNATAIQEISVIQGGETDQRNAINRSFIDAAAATEALNAVHTIMRWNFLELAGGPFETIYNIEVSDLMIPKTIDLEAA